MGTRGTYGIRKNGEDKLTYNHFDSDPSYLGRLVFGFCQDLSIEDLNKFADKLELVNQETNPTLEQIEICKANGFFNDSVSRQSDTDWYCLLRNLQGDFQSYKELTLNENVNTIFMIDNGNFIKDSLFCEYGYIINLDDEVLEFWKGFQNTPDPENRYGAKPYEGYSSISYPCKMVACFELSKIAEMSVSEIVDLMEMLEYAIYDEDKWKWFCSQVRDQFSGMDFDSIEIQEIIKKCYGHEVLGVYENLDEAAEANARSLGILTDQNERYFDLKTYGEDLLEDETYIKVDYQYSEKIIYIAQ